MSFKQFLEFWPFKKCFFPWDWERIKRPKKGWWRHVTSADLLSLASDYSHCFEFCGIKQGIWLWKRYCEATEDSEGDWGQQIETTTILRICCHLVDYSTFLSIILRHTSQFGLAIGRPFQEENLRVSKTKNKFCKIFDEFKSRIHILQIFKNKIRQNKLRVICTLSNDPGKKGSNSFCCGAIRFPHIEMFSFLRRECIDLQKGFLRKKMYLNSTFKGCIFVLKHLDQSQELQTMAKKCSQFYMIRT